MNRRSFLGGMLGAASLSWAGCRRSEGKLTVGFSQMDTAGAWRIAETNSLRSAAAAHGYNLVVTSAEDQTAKQVSDVEDLIARRVRAVFIAPRDYDGLEPVFETARRAGVPVFLIDREAAGVPGVDYVCFLGSDFVEQGRRAARWLAERTGGQARVAELSGTPGSSVERDRAAGFREALADYQGMRIVASQTASFSRAAARAVMANLIQARGGDITAIFAHNDEMALGAIQALEAAQVKPGEDVILVSIDGERAALEAVVQGTLGATIESNPRFGPLAFETLERYFAGETVPSRIILPDRLFDASNAAKSLDDAY